MSLTPGPGQWFGHEPTFSQSGNVRCRLCGSFISAGMGPCSAAPAPLAANLVFAGGRVRTVEECRRMAAASARYTLEGTAGGATVEDVMRQQGLDRPSAEQALADLCAAGIAVQAGPVFAVPNRDGGGR